MVNCSLLCMVIVQAEGLVQFWWDGHGLRGDGHLLTAVHGDSAG